MKKEKQFRAVLNLIMIGLLVVAALVLPFKQETSARQDSRSEANERSGVPAEGGGCSDLSGKWISKTSEGSMTWELWKTKETEKSETYRVKQISPGDAKGFAAGLFEENTLVLEYDWRTATGERWAGKFKCKLDANCQASISSRECQLGLYKDGSWEGTSDATIKRQ